MKRRADYPMVARRKWHAFREIRYFARAKARCSAVLIAICALAMGVAHAEDTPPDDAGTRLLSRPNMGARRDSPTSDSRTSYARTSKLDTQFRLALTDFDRAQEIQTEQPDRARQLFRSAAQRFESIAASGIANGRLEYNLGNCYLQAGDVGRAILHYRRAERLIPRDPPLADNLAEARSRCLTTLQPTRRSALLKNVFFWHYETSMSGRWQAAIACYVAFWVLLAIRSIATHYGTGLRVGGRTLGVSATVAAVLASALAGSVGAQRSSDRRAPEGVITTMDVAVYKGPGTTYQRQFEQPLQAGVEFTLLEDRAGWWNIRLADGKNGWIDASTGDLIVSPHRQARLGAS
ncbi:MAG: SH3 domain-containing protein [Planctomycetota bacterium]|jgi:hypothetical protein